MTIIYWAAGWLVGIWLGSVLSLPMPLWLISGVICLAAALLLRRQPIAPAILVTLAALALGAVRYSQSRAFLDQYHIAHFVGREEVVITGIVSEAPDVRDKYQNLVVDVETLAIEDGTERIVHGKILARARRFPLIAYGSRVQVQGELEQPQNTGQFDYRGYLAGRGIYAVVGYPEVTVLAQRVGNPLMHILLDVRDRAQETIERLLPQPQAALLSGILLGDEGHMTADLREDFRTTGMTHIIAISGFNIAIIAGALMQGSRHLLGNRRAAWVAIGGIALYTLFVGAEAAVVRAAVMATLFVVAARLLGRPTFVPATLFAAAFFMTLADPDILWNVGFQLSFSATLGLMLFVGPWSDYFRAVWQQRFGEQTGNRLASFFAEVFLATTAAMILTLPLLIYHFGTFSLVSSLANLLILPVQPAIMTFGGIATAAGMVSPVIGQVPAWITWLFLSYTIELVQFFATLPLATVPVSLPAWAIALTYTLILSFTWLFRNGPPRIGSESAARLRDQGRRLTPMAVALAALLVIAWAWNQPDGRLHVVFFDVGQGDAILIHTPDGRQVLVDGGAYPDLLLSRLGEQLPFWDKQIDLVIATHSDTDHVAGLVDLFSHYNVGQLITNGADPDASAGFQALLQAAEQSGTVVRTAVTGETIEFGSAVQIAVLHPGAPAEKPQDNDHAIVMRLCYDEFSLLLTGDVGEIVEKQLLENGPELQSTVLKASHHGSRSASSRPFLQVVQPQIVVVSTGSENRFGHPHTETLQRFAEVGAAVWRTDELGTIDVASDGKQVWSSASKN